MFPTGTPTSKPPAAAAPSPAPTSAGGASGSEGEQVLGAAKQVPGDQFAVEEIGGAYFEEGVANDLDFVSRFAGLERNKIEETTRHLNGDGSNGPAFDAEDRKQYLVRKLEDMPLRDFDFDDEEGELVERVPANCDAPANKDTTDYLSALQSEQSGLPLAAALANDNPFATISAEAEQESAASREKREQGEAQRREKEAQAKEKQAQGLTKAFNEAKECVRHAPKSAPAAVTECGKIHAHVDGVIVVHANLDSRALDLGSVLCMENREVLGQICDVFGQIEQPHYLVFPSAVEQAQSEGRTSGEQIGAIVRQIAEQYAVGSPVFFLDDKVSFAVDEDGIAFPPTHGDEEEEYGVEGAESDEEM